MQALIVFTYVYEYSLRGKWLSAKFEGLDTDAEIFIIRVCMSLCLGISALSLVFDGETWRVWQKACDRFCWQKKKPDTQFPMVAYSKQNQQVPIVSSMKFHL